jgi:hypothetical protein
MWSRATVTPLKHGIYKIYFSSRFHLPMEVVPMTSIPQDRAAWSWLHREFKFRKSHKEISVDVQARNNSELAEHSALGIAPKRLEVCQIPICTPHSSQSNLDGLTDNDSIHSMETAHLLICSLVASLPFWKSVWGALTLFPGPAQTTEAQVCWSLVDIMSTAWTLDSSISSLTLFLAMTAAWQASSNFYEGRWLG